MNIFQKVTDFVKRDFSTFDMSNNWIGSVMDFGSLNKIYSSIVLPADQWKLGHNAIVKLPPLVAPAFTRIKGLVNSFYVSYQSVWNYWNSFISNKPEDAYLTRSALTAYNGKFVEPYVPMAFIALICKIAKGYFLDLHFKLVDDGVNSRLMVYWKPLMRTYNSTTFPDDHPTSITWSVSAYGRSVLLGYPSGEHVPDVTAPVSPGDSSASEAPDVNYELLEFPLPYWRSTIPSESLFGDNSIDVIARMNGFDSLSSMFIWLCQSVVRNLENAGVPCNLLAESPYELYKDDKFNLLNYICESAIWQNFYRDSQNQASEIDYREVNGCLFDPRHLYYGSPASSYTSDTNPFGWYMKMNGLPPNSSLSDSDPGYYFRLYHTSGVIRNNHLGCAFAVLTGFLLKQVVVNKNSFLKSGSTACNLVPDFYNGLLSIKYRNFEKDYFTSASVDPLMGGMQVSVPSTIDALRTASKFEEYLERWTSAKDFVSFMESSYGEKPRERYIKPVFLGSQEIKVQIGEQLQTSQSTQSSPLGERAGTAEGYSSSATVYETFKEHGFIVSYLSFIIPSQYMEGMPHEFMHHLQFDYPWPDFANLGAEMIPTSEIYYGMPVTRLLDNSVTQSLANQTASGATVVDSRVVTSVDELLSDDLASVGDNIFVPLDDQGGARSTSCEVSVTWYDRFGRGSDLGIASTPFGYTPRYSRWKFKQDVVAGQMRDSMDYWHTFRQFSNVPHISNSFVSYMFAGFTSNLNRIFAVENDNADKFYVSIFNNGSCRRCLPLVPSTSLN